MSTASDLIDELWREGDTLQLLHDRLERDVLGLSPVVAAIIGKELLLRSVALSTSDFATAAFLASDGEAGNDSLTDFVDCVAVLPSVRYQRIRDNHDNLIEDKVSQEFGELCFYNLFEQRFEGVFGEEGEGLLAHLSLGDPAPELRPQLNDSKAEIERRFPRLYQRYGHLLSSTDRMRSGGGGSSRATLDDFLD